jgi:probable rRNA maturation factor
MARGLEVIVGDAHGRPLRIAGLSSWLQRVASARMRGRVSIALVSDDRIRTLNRIYRGMDYATDVLSFPENPPPLKTQRTRRDRPVSSSMFSVPVGAENFLGDIVIARGAAKRQAREAHHSELTELRVLALHGLLHLLGYDHENDRGRMRRLERRLRRKGGLREGLIERAASPGRTRLGHRVGGPDPRQSPRTARRRRDTRQLRRSLAQ